jgi:hypothetical protein
VKTTIELPDQLLRDAKATAAVRGESLKEFVTDALRNHLAARPGRGVAVGTEAWREFVGIAPKEVTDEIDAAIEEAFEQIEPDDLD